MKPRQNASEAASQANTDRRTRPDAADRARPADAVRPGGAELDPFLEAVSADLPATERSMFRPYAEALLAGVDSQSTHSCASLAAQAERIFAFARRRERGEILLRFHNPPGCENRSVIEIVQDDRPFLVDTVRMALRRLDLREFFLLHPIIPVERAEDGTLAAVGGAATSPESVIFIEAVPRVIDPARCAQIEGELRSVLSDVRDVTADHRRMIRAVRELAAEVEFAGQFIDGGPARAARISRFLEWILQDRFVLIGIRRYDLRYVDGEPQVQLAPDSGLGLWRRNAESFFADTKRGEEIPNEVVEILRDPRIISIDKSRIESRIHRAGRLDRIVLMNQDERGEASGFTIIVGLFSFRALQTPGSQIPLYAERLDNILAQDGAPPGSHRYKAIVAAFDSAPVEFLLGSEPEGVAALISEIIASEGSEEIHLVMRSDRTGRSFYAAVLLPRQHYREGFRNALRALFEERTGATYIDDRVSFIEETTALLHFFGTSAAGRLLLPPAAELEREIRAECASWESQLRQALMERYDEDRAASLGFRYCEAFPEALRVATHPADAVRDVAALEGLYASGEPQFALFFDRKGDPREACTLRIFLPEARLLSELLPVIDTFGIQVIDAQQTRVEPDARKASAMVSLRVLPLGATQDDLDAIAPRLFAALSAALTGTVEWDRLNGLVLGAGLDWREVDALRAYLDYFQQIQGTLGRPFLRTVMLENPLAVRTLVAYHAARLDPGISDEERAAREEELRQQFEVYRARIDSLNEDRALLAVYQLIDATLRTSFFNPSETGRTIAFKIDPAKLPSLRPPYPYREIFVHAAAFRGIHIRGGPVSRGGLRWSDRADDLRTEILGLARTQMLKNGLIVPVGAKGGFVLKGAGRSPREARAEADRQYRVFIAALLDLTDNFDEAGRVVPPSKMVGRDGEDPYLVVAADKGTAHLSDAANEVARSRGFWLGDAFASGGSQGYDHKKYGITARGAWECVKHHFLELGHDVERDPFTIVGIGDMSGDVFGNGLLLARRGHLVAAFDHRHVFLDPNPDAEVAWRERKRLYDTPGSSWADYDPALISTGGGVFARSAKSITLSPEVRERLGVDDEALTGDALVSAILAAPVDLLWNGGIGTYVKASRETNLDVGDRANDAVRIDASQLRARVLAEGGNLGLTQAARIEAASGGTRLNTDAIDNSAGVDLSDHEVNFKILLAPLLQRGALSEPKRDELLAEVAETACEYVLAHNRRQALALSLDERRSQRDLAPFERTTSALCTGAEATPNQLGVPDATEWLSRRESGTGLFRPELAVLLGMAKLQLRQALATSARVDHRGLSHFYEQYFPPLLREHDPDALAQHRLRREITALCAASHLVDAFGATGVLDFAAEARLPLDEAACALLGAETILRVPSLRAELIALPVTVSRDAIYAALLVVEDAVRDVARLLALAGVDPLDERLLEAWNQRLVELSDAVETFLSTFDRGQLALREAALLQSGIPAAMASTISRLPLADRGLNIVRVCEGSGYPLLQAAQVYTSLGAAVGLDTAYGVLPSLRTRDSWERQLARALRDELLGLQRELTREALVAADGDLSNAAAHFLGAHSKELERIAELRDVVFREPSASALAVWARAVQGLRAKTS
jgi:glutamate dehydrogenase